MFAISEKHIGERRCSPSLKSKLPRSRPNSFVDDIILQSQGTRQQAVEQAVDSIVVLKEGLDRAKLKFASKSYPKSYPSHTPLA